MDNIEITYARILLGKELAKQIRTYMYGLHYKTDFISLSLKDMGLMALEYNADNNYYTEDEVACIGAKLNININNCC